MGVGGGSNRNYKTCVPEVSNFQLDHLMNDEKINFILKCVNGLVSSWVGNQVSESRFMNAYKSKKLNHRRTYIFFSLAPTTNGLT